MRMDAQNPHGQPPSGINANRAIENVGGGERGAENLRDLAGNEELLFYDVAGLMDEDEGGAGFLFGEFFDGADGFFFGEAFGAGLLGAFLNDSPLLQVLVRGDVVYQRILHNRNIVRGQS